MIRRQKNYEFIDVELINKYIKDNDYGSLINYTSTLRWNLDKVKAAKMEQYIKELRICENAVADLIFSCEDKKMIDKLVYALIDNVDLFEDVFENICTKLIKDKSPEEVFEVYKKIKYYFYSPSHTVLDYLSSKTTSADTCLYIINDLEENYKKHGVNRYNDYILDFYKRFRVVCTKEEYENFIQSGMKSESGWQKQ